MNELRVHNPDAPYSLEQLIGAVLGRAKLRADDPIAVNAARLAIDFALGNPGFYESWQPYPSIPRKYASSYILSAFTPLGWKAWFKFVFTANRKVEKVLHAMENLFWWSGAREDFFKSLMALKEKT